MVTIYLFSTLQGHFKQAAMHRYVAGHWAEWFPHLPNYQAFNHRLNLLHEIWPVLLGELWCQLGQQPPAALARLDQWLDSWPIMFAVRGRSDDAKVALDQADQGYCESKKLWYHGIKLHLLGAKQYQRDYRGKVAIETTSYKANTQVNTPVGGGRRRARHDAYSESCQSST